MSADRARVSADGSRLSADLAVVVVSTNEAAWLPACLASVLEHAGGIELDLVVVDNGSRDGTAELVARDFPRARVVEAENRGFPHANNVALVDSEARYQLLLNPDTEVVRGELAELVRWLDEHPGVGAAGVRQRDGDGRLLPTIRRFPSPLRALGEAVGAERLPFGRRALTERELDPAAYERVTPCDWSVGSFLLLRREALLAAGLLDERLFLYSDEPDLCLRVRRAGWGIVHLPFVEIVHHVRATRGSPRNEAQAALSRRVLARRHMAPLARAAYLGGLALRYGLRAAAPGSAERREVNRSALRGLLGRGEAPYATPPPAALATDWVPSAGELAVVVVSHGDADWLPGCLRSLAERAGGVELEVVVVENGPDGRTDAAVAEALPRARVIRAENRGFAHASNVGLLATAGARYQLLLNPDTEVVEGELAELVHWLDEHPAVGAAGVRQLGPDGRLLPTIRRFPSPLRALGEAVGVERIPRGGARLSERERDPAAYARVTPCDWTVGSFLLLRRAALLSAGLLDERLFLYSDEPDLCLRLRRAGWEVVHLPLVTVVHHDRAERGSERNEAQAALSRRVYARKHMSPLARAAYLGAVAARHALRAAAPGPPERRAAARAALATLAGRRPAPFAELPPVALPAAPPESRVDGR